MFLGVLPAEGDPTRAMTDSKLSEDSRGATTQPAAPSTAHRSSACSRSCRELSLQQDILSVRSAGRRLSTVPRAQHEGTGCAPTAAVHAVHLLPSLVASLGACDSAVCDSDACPADSSDLAADAIDDCGMTVAVDATRLNAGWGSIFDIVTPPCPVSLAGSVAVAVSVFCNEDEEVVSASQVVLVLATGLGWLMDVS